jgi:hypothetical protein
MKTQGLEIAVWYLEERATSPRSATMVTASMLARFLARSALLQSPHGILGGALFTISSIAPSRSATRAARWSTSCGNPRRVTCCARTAEWPSGFTHSRSLPFQRVTLPDRRSCRNRNWVLVSRRRARRRVALCCLPSDSQHNLRTVNRSRAFHSDYEAGSGIKP